MENKNIACRIFKEQIDLVLALPEQDRAEVLYKAIISVFNQFDNQFDNQIENQNENAYVSVSDNISIIGKKVFNLLEKNIVCKEFSNNYGGKRIGAGKKKTKRTNQIENQNDNQIEKQIEIKNLVNEHTMIKAGFQNWTFPPEIKKIAVKYWSAETIREIEKQFSCQEYATETSIFDLLQTYPPKPKKKITEITNYGQYEYLHPQMDKWLDYKKSRGERYKTEQSLLICAKKLHELSGGNALQADAIVEQSIANNYAGLFPLKQAQPNMPKMTFKDMKDIHNQQEIQKILNGER